jgi:hypothetical protein
MTEQTVGATAKQQYWISKCLTERVVPDALAARAAGPLSKKDASAVLTSLFECPKQAAAKPAYEKSEPAALGYYVVENEAGTPFVYVVVESKKSGHKVAKRLVRPTVPGARAKWVYAKGAVFKLAKYEPITVQQAASFGHLHGWCVICGANLDKPLSVEAGIGPVCVKKFGMTQTQFLASKGESA